MTTPKAFISYSHDNLLHKQWVLMLATRLRESGVDAILDLWELQPGADLPAFMEKNLVSSDHVIMVCTDNYVTKANAGTGGVGYEKMIVTADLVKSIDSTKVIPIVRQSGTNNIPTFLRSKLYLDFSLEDQFEFGFDELTRTLHKAPLFVKPAVGNNPFPSTLTSITPEQTGDPLVKVMKVMVKLFESKVQQTYFLYTDIAGEAKLDGISRLYLDVLIEQAKQKKLIDQSDNYFAITDVGKAYAVQHNLG